MNKKPKISFECSCLKYGALRSACRGPQGCQAKIEHEAYLESKKPKRWVWKKEHQYNKDMTDQQINIAIAEACGYKKHEEFYRWRDPQTKELLCWKSLPDCCNDLNVMHEVWVAKIKGNEVLEDLFTIWLGAICCGEPISDRPDLSDANIAIVTNATARQRAEAFLRTIGKWEGGPQ